MVAILLLAIAIIPMVGMFDAGLRAAMVGSNYDQARALANEKLEETRALEYGTVEARYPVGSQRNCSPPPPADLNFISSCKVHTAYAAFPTAGARNVMQVTVTVSWGSGNNYTTTGMIAR